MPANEYHFISRWKVEGTVQEVADILKESEGLVRWWPSVYLDVKVVERGDGRGIGKVVRLHTKGWLPYTLRWQFQVTESRYPYGFSLRASGDFDGEGIWSFEQEGKWVNITYDWRIRAEKHLLKALSFLLKPLFSANHRWAMARGEEGLKRELERVRSSKQSQP